MVRPQANFPSVDLKAYNIAEEIIFYTQQNHVIQKPKAKKTEAEKKLKKTEFNFLGSLETLIQNFG